MKAAAATPIDEFERLRGRLLDEALLLTSIVGGVGAAISLARVPLIGWRPLMLAHVLTVVVLWCAWLSRRRLSYGARASTFLGVLWLSAIGGPISLGPFALSGIMMVLFTFSAVLFTRARHALWLIVVASVSLILVGIGAVRGWLVYDPSYARFIDSPVVWTQLVWVSVAYSATIAFVGWRMVTALVHRDAASRDLTARLGGALRAAQAVSWEFDGREVSLVGRVGAAPDSLFAGAPGDPMAAIVPEDRARLKEALAAGWKGGEPVLVETRVVRPDATVGWLAWQAEGRDTRASGVPLAGLVQCITARKAAELASAAAKSSADAANRAKREFLVFLSHEIRSATSAVASLAKLAIDKQPGSPSRDFLERIGSATQSLLGIVDDVLDFERIEAGRLRLERTRFRVGDVLRDVADLLGPPAEAKGLRLRVVTQPRVPDTVIGDPGRLRQVLVNLCWNAMKFTARGEIVVGVDADDESQSGLVALRFEVRDTGEGMTRPEVESLFEPFAQAGAGRGVPASGSGMGLVICKRLVEMMGGGIEIDSAAGAGTSVRFSIVCGLADLEAAGVPPARESEPGDDGALRGRRILVADDNEVSREWVAHILGAAGAGVGFARDGAEAVARIAGGEHFDAVVMDLRMPVMDGDEAARAIRSGERGASLPILALTAAVSREERERCATAGMDRVLAKPVRAADLCDALAGALGVSPVTPGEHSPASRGSPPDRDPERARAASERFRVEESDATARIRAMIAAGDREAAARALHSLGGSAAFVGADELREAALATESVVLAGGDAQAALEWLDELVARVLEPAGEPR